MTDARQRDGATVGSADSDAVAAASDAVAADSDGAAERAHLADVEDGCGCAEVWEHLSERREAGAD